MSNPQPAGQKILIVNADGSVGQLYVDATGAFKVAGNVTATLSAGTSIVIQDASTSANKLAVDGAGKIGVNALPSIGQLPSALASDGSEKVSDTGLNWKPSIPISNAASPYTSTASYASAISGPVNITRPYSTITLHVKENNTNAITYQILGYLETSTYARPIVLATGIAVAKNGDDYEIVTLALAAIDVQVMDTVGGTHGSAIVDVAMV